MFTLAKFRAIMPTTATLDSHHCTCIGHLGRCNTDRIVSISCRAAQGGQGKYCLAAQGDCHMSLSPTVLLTNVANVNDPLAMNMLTPGCTTKSYLGVNKPTTETSLLNKKSHLAST
jgi:hypothetical protein